MIVFYALGFVLIVTLICLFYFLYKQNWNIDAVKTNLFYMFDKNQTLLDQLIEEHKTVLAKNRIRKGIVQENKQWKVHEKNSLIYQFLPYYHLWWNGDEILPLLSFNRRKDSGKYLVTLFDVSESEYIYLGYIFLEIRCNTAVIRHQYTKPDIVKGKLTLTFVNAGEDVESMDFDLQDLPGCYAIDPAKLDLYQPTRLRLWFAS